MDSMGKVDSNGASLFKLYMAQQSTQLHKFPARTGSCKFCPKMTAVSER
jgi:hypothetical protein